MLGEPASHLLIGPGPLEGVDVEPVVLRPRRGHLRDDLVTAGPRPTLQIAGAVAPDEQLGLVEPRRMSRGPAGPPPAPGVGGVAARLGGDVTRPAVLDQVHAPQAVSATGPIQRLDVMICVVLRQADGLPPPGVDRQEDQDVDRAVADVLELLPLDPAGDRPPDRDSLQGLEVGDLIGTHDPDGASGQAGGMVKS